MFSAYAMPGAVALVEWLLAATLYAVGWYRMKYGLYRVGDGLVLAGLVTALAGVAWLAWDVSPDMVLARSSLATGLAVSALIVYAVLARRPTEGLPAAAMLVFAIPIQVYAVEQLCWRVEAVPLGVFLPVWMAFHALTGLIGYGGLAVSGMMIILSFALSRMGGKLSANQLAAAVGLPALEWRSLQIALVALSVSLSVGLIRLWWGLGQVVVGGFAWALITWLLLAAGAYGCMQGAIPRRPARGLLVLACVVSVVAVLSMAVSLTGTSP
jgi:hypothetical protein